MQLNEILAAGVGKDLTSELSNVQFRDSLEYITTHLKVGKYCFNDMDEKVRNTFNLILATTNH